MTNKEILNLENRLHGYHTRLKELHYSSPTMSIHKDIDEFDKELQSFDDAIMEDAQAIFGFIEPGSLNPVLPKSLEIEDLLVEIRADLGNCLDSWKNASMWTGIVDQASTFWHVINQTIYKIKIDKKEIK